MTTHIAILGAGVQGMLIAWDLASHGHRVTVVEAADQPGGLAGAMSLPELGGLSIDRFYHCILSSDRCLMGVFDALGLKDQLRFTTTGMAFYGQPQGGGAAGLYAMSTPKEFLTFPLVSLPARARLAASLLYSAYGVRDPDKLETVPVEPWLRQVAGDQIYERLWGPLLDSKFDGRFEQLPASYMWARLKRMLSTRDKTSGVEQMGHLIGGYQTLIDKLASDIEHKGGRVLTRTRVQALLRSNEGHVQGLRLQHPDGTASDLRADATVATVGNDLLKSLLGEPFAPSLREPLDTIGVLAIVCPVLVLDRSLSPYYTINLLDRSLSMTGVIETTRIISPELLGGRHLVYLPKYCWPDAPVFTQPDDEVLERFLTELARVIPGFDRRWILASRVMRARATEPFHPVAAKRALLPYAPPDVPGLYLANATQVYPDLVNCEAMARNVARALPKLHAALTPPQAVGATPLSRPQS